MEQLTSFKLYRNQTKSAVLNLVMSHLPRNKGDGTNRHTDRHTRLQTTPHVDSTSLEACCVKTIQRSILFQTKV